VTSRARSDHAVSNSYEVQIRSLQDFPTRLSSCILAIAPPLSRLLSILTPAPHQSLRSFTNSQACAAATALQVSIRLATGLCPPPAASHKLQPHSLAGALGLLEARAMLGAAPAPGLYQSVLLPCTSARAQRAPGRRLASLQCASNPILACCVLLLGAGPVRHRLRCWYSPSSRQTAAAFLLIPVSDCLGLKLAAGCRSRIHCCIRAPQPATHPRRIRTALTHSPTQVSGQNPLLPATCQQP